MMKVKNHEIFVSKKELLDALNKDRTTMGTSTYLYFLDLLESLTEYSVATMINESEVDDGK